MELNVYGDCWQLLQDFGRAVDESQEAKFEIFCHTWHELQMQHIYSAQTTHIEVIETTLAALHVAKRVACSRRTNGEIYPATRAHRIGGIYLMYTIFNKQPTKWYIKIDVSPNTWQSLSDYVEQLRREGAGRRDTQQVSYIFWRLIQDQAFRYTGLDYCMALDALAAYDSLENFVEAKQQKNQSATLLNQQLKLSRGNLNEELHGITELTNSCKTLCELETAYNKQMNSYRASFSATNIFSQLRNVFCEIIDILTDDERPTSSNNVNEQLEVRKRARHKAMFGDSNGEKSPEEIVAKAEKRMSSATVFERKLPDDVIREKAQKRMSSATVFERKLPDDVIRDLEG